MGGKFYVYEHWRPDRDECFYVGLGSGRRANALYGRNFMHMAIQKKLAGLGLGVEVKFVAIGLDREEAIALEIERIALWRADGADLCNMTAGGDGAPDPSEETRAKMRAAKVGRKLTEEHKRKVGEASRRTWQDPEYRERHRASQAIVFASPEYKAKQSKAQSEKPRTKEHYEKVAAALRGQKLTPERVEKTRQANLGRKQPAAEIEKRRVANTGKKRSPEFCARMKAMWTPERKAAEAERMRLRWADPQEGAKMMAENLSRPRGAGNKFVKKTCGEAS